MLCTKCGKNEANVYFSRTINGNKTEYNLCTHCAKESGIMESLIKHENYVRSSLFAPMGALGLQPLTGPALSGLFDDFFDCDLLSGNSEAPETEPKKEPEAPEVEAPADKISRLRAKLQDAVKEERYEDAARFRDEIKALEQGK